MSEVPLYITTEVTDRAGPGRGSRVAALDVSPKGSKVPPRDRERGSNVEPLDTGRLNRDSNSNTLQGYLAHRKTPTPLGPP